MNILKRLWQSVRIPSPFAIPSETLVPRRGGRSRGRISPLEEMESRVLLTALTAGTYTFVDAGGDDYTITLTGNIVAEAYASDGAGLVDLTDDTAATPLDVYAIYVTQSDINATLVIQGSTPGSITLFGGALAAPSGAGQIYIGDRLSGLPAGTDVPILSIVNGGAISPEAQALADAAGPAGEYRPGVFVAGDMDLIFVEGAITGRVYIGGSITYFACDWLITGDGLLGGDAYDDDFYVGGNMANFVVNTNVGTEAVDIDMLDPLSIWSDTGVDIHVAGRIGTVYTKENFVGSITADNVTVLDGYYWYESSGWNAYFDTFVDPYYLGTNIDDAVEAGIHVTGSVGTVGIPGDNHFDYYAFSALAGQTYFAQLTVDESAQFVVYDPDGRVVFTTATDSLTGQASYGFTADRSGAYRIAIAMAGDLDATDSASAMLATDYTLDIQGMNETAIGGIDINGDMVTKRLGINAGLGDIGTIHVEETFWGDADDGSGFHTNDITVNDGDLIHIDVIDAMGGIDPGFALVGAPIIEVLNGGIGLIHSSDLLTAEWVYARGDIQIIDADGRLEGQFVSDASIGLIRAASIEGNASVQDYIGADYDRVGRDGFIDLIDVTGTFGTLEFGGPRITTGTGGNLRFLHIGGPLFQDLGFVGGETSANGGIVWGVGEVATFRDDSGALITISPTAAGSLTTYTYGIWGSGGVAIAKIVADSSVSISVTSTNNSPLERADIGEIAINTAGAPLITTDLIVNGLTVSVPANDPAPLALTPPSSLTISGKIPTDVFLISGVGTLNTISNTTRGDIVNVNYTGDIGTLSVPGSLGTTRNSTGAEINQIAVIANTFPFIQQHIGIVANNIAVLSAGKSIGNIILTGGLGSLVANAGNVDDPTLFEGIVGPVQVGGNIGSVAIGEGLMESGSAAYSYSTSYGAAMSHGGIYATGTIATVKGSNADIRGDIISTTTIGPIALNNGSIVGSQIAVYSSLAMADYLWASSVTLPETADLVSVPIFEIVSVSLTGNGGIIGSLFMGADIGPVSVASTGFGILNSGFYSLGDGVIQNLTAGGYGIRDVGSNGAKINVLNATGKGNTVPVSNYSIRVRGSETGAIDPLTGLAYSSENDLAIYMAELGLGDIRTGIIADSNFTGSLSLGSATAFTYIRVDLNFANMIGSIKSNSDLDELQVITGGISSFTVKGDVTNLDFQVAGRIGLFQINGDFVNGLIYAKGPSSNMERLVVTGDFSGDFTSEGILGSITVGTNPSRTAVATGDFTGNIELFGGVSANSLTFNAGFTGTFESEGDIASMTFKQGLEAGATFLVNGDLGTLTIGGSYLVNNGFAGTFDVVGNLGKFVVVGGFTGTANVGGNLGSATVSGATTGTLDVTGNIGSFTQSTNAFDGIINAGGSITTFAAKTFTAGADITAASLGTFTLKGSATGGQVNLSGNLTNMSVTGNVTGAQLIVGGLGAMTVKGNFAAGTLLDAAATGPASTINITGTLAGIITTDGAIKSLAAGNVSSAVVTTGQGIETITVKNALLNSLIQAGITAGDDGVFGTADANESTNQVAIGRIIVGTMTNTTIAAGGAITSFTSARNLINSGVSTAMVVDGAAVQNVVTGANALSSVPEVNTLRMNPTLFIGTFSTASVARGLAGGLDSDSYLTAGVSPGADGVFGTGDDVYDGVSVIAKATVAASDLGQLLQN